MRENESAHAGFGAKIEDADMLVKTENKNRTLRFIILLNHFFLWFFEPPLFFKI